VPLGGKLDSIHILVFSIKPSRQRFWNNMLACQPAQQCDNDMLDMFFAGKKKQ
jgi:hypothetical protein